MRLENVDSILNGPFPLKTFGPRRIASASRVTWIMPKLRRVGA
jgi:hypothetical protein